MMSSNVHTNEILYLRALEQLKRNNQMNINHTSSVVTSSSSPSSKLLDVGKLAGKSRENVQSAIEVLTKQLKMVCDRIDSHTLESDPFYDKRKKLIERVKMISDCIKELQNLL